MDADFLFYETFCQFVDSEGFSNIHTMNTYFNFLFFSYDTQLNWLDSAFQINQKEQIFGNLCDVKDKCNIFFKALLEALSALILFSISISFNPLSHMNQSKPYA